MAAIIPAGALAPPVNYEKSGGGPRQSWPQGAQGAPYGKTLNFEP
jgi:hypothetical protein